MHSNKIWKGSRYSLTTADVSGEWSPIRDLNLAKRNGHSDTRLRGRKFCDRDSLSAKMKVQFTNG